MKIKSFFVVSFLALVFGFRVHALNVSWALSARQGDPSYMEDTFSVQVPFSAGRSDGFLAIYDGHGGKDAANYIANKLPAWFAKSEPHLMTGMQIMEALKKTFSTVNTNLEADLPENTSGSTASVVYLKNGKAYFAWVGDSRIMLLKNDGSISFLSKEHKPTDLVEKMRINAINPSDSGIFIDEKTGRLKVAKEEGDFFSSLAVSRSFGDFDFNPVVTAHPEVRVELLEEGDIVVIASDGMWDEIEPVNDQNNLEEDENPGVVNIVHGVLQKRQLTNMAQEYLELPTETRNEVQDAVVDTASPNASRDLQFVARFLRDQAYEKAAQKYEDGGDNISVLVIRVEE